VRRPSDLRDAARLQRRVPPRPRVEAPSSGTQHQSETGSSTSEFIAPPSLRPAPWLQPPTSSRKSRRIRIRRRSRRCGALPLLSRGALGSGGPHWGKISFPDLSPKRGFRPNKRPSEWPPSPNGRSRTASSPERAPGIPGRSGTDDPLRRTARPAPIRVVASAPPGSRTPNLRIKRVKTAVFRGSLELTFVSSLQGKVRI